MPNDKTSEDENTICLRCKTKSDRFGQCLSCGGWSKIDREHAASQEQKTESIAALLWHRFASDDRLDRTEETQKVDFLNTARAILEIADAR